MAVKKTKPRKHHTCLQLHFVYDAESVCMSAHIRMHTMWVVRQMFVRVVSDDIT